MIPIEFNVTKERVKLFVEKKKKRKRRSHSEETKRSRRTNS